MDSPHSHASMGGLTIQRTQPIDGVILLRLSGPLTLNTARLLREALLHELREANVALDLAEVTETDAAGVGVLVSAHRRARDASRWFRLAAPPQDLRRLLEVTHLDQTLSVWETVEEALA